MYERWFLQLYEYIRNWDITGIKTGQEHDKKSSSPQREKWLILYHFILDYTSVKKFADNEVSVNLQIFTCAYMKQIHTMESVSLRKQLTKQTLGVT